MHKIILLLVLGGIVQSSMLHYITDENHQEVFTEHDDDAMPIISRATG